MELQKLETIAANIKQLGILNEEIKQIELLAEKAANDPCTVLLNLSLFDGEEQNKEPTNCCDVAKDTDNEVERMADRYAKDIDFYRKSFFYAIGPLTDRSMQLRPNKIKVNQKINEIATLQILGVLLGEKLRLKDAIIKELKANNIL